MKGCAARSIGTKPSSELRHEQHPVAYLPVVWRDGIGGYRSEELVVVTADGFEQLTRYGYSPFD